MEGLTYNININGLDSLSEPAVSAAMGGIIGFALSVGLAIAVLLIIAWWKIFEKAGEKGWKALIPIYNCYILFKICGIKTWFWVFLGVSIFASVLMGIDMPAQQEITVNFLGTSVQTVGNVEINWAEHVPYLIATIIEAGAGIAVAIAIAVRLAKAFKKGVGFTFGLIFLSGIFYMILGFGKAKYDKKAVNVEN